MTTIWKKRTLQRGRRSTYVCSGGPYGGVKLKLCSPGTAEFSVTINGEFFKGRYDRDMNWVSTYC